jgi:monoamine oxidase
MYLFNLGQYGRMKMSHMMADTHEELVEMVKKIDLDPKWIQHKGRPDEHFDLSISKRKLAVQNGAVEITMREMALYNRKKREAHKAKTQM